MPNYHILAELSEVTLPSIIYCGRHDAQCPLVFSEEISASISQSALYIFEESNHLPYLEEKDLFAQMVHHFKKLAAPC